LRSATLDAGSVAAGELCGNRHGILYRELISRRPIVF
jgi:hypothetical protein